MVARLAEVDLLELVECVVVLELESFFADWEASELALFELEALCCALFLLDESAFCDALLEAEFEDEFALFEALEAELWLEPELSLDAD